VEPEHVVGETLQRVTNPGVISPDELRGRVSDPLSDDTFDAFVTDPLAAWAEQTFGFEPGSPTDAPTRRRRPPTLPEAAHLLAGETSAADEECLAALKDVLQAGARIVNPATGRPVFAFRVHQFFSKGDNVYVTLELPAQRHVTST